MTKVRTHLVAAALATAALAPATALAQETLDVGVLKDSDISVVQKLLYPKEGATEMGAAIGWMPFDSYTTTPVASFRFARHFSEQLAGEVDLTGGYSLKNYAYKQLESPAYGIQPDAYRYLAGLMLDAQWSPIYAKMNWRGANVIHHDVYLLGGLGGALEQAMMPDGSMTFAPGVGVGAGFRVFNKKGKVWRIQVRDDILAEKRVKTADTQAWFLKQNVALTVGYSSLKKK